MKQKKSMVARRNGHDPRIGTALAVASSDPSMGISDSRGERMDLSTRPATLRRGRWESPRYWWTVTPRRVPLQISSESKATPRLRFAGAEAPSAGL